jgi:hypothetical protein
MKRVSNLSSAMVGAALVAALALSGCTRKVEAYLCADNKRAHAEVVGSINECSATPGCKVEQSSIAMKRRIEARIEMWCKNETPN